MVVLHCNHSTIKEFIMIVARNPTPEKIRELIELSKSDAAKWIKNNETGETWYWPADESFHANMAKILHVTDYEKGIAIT